jgi:hypothetical protein
MKRYVRGVLKGVHAEPGTVLGPNDTREYMAVIEDRPEGVAVGYATQDEVRAALDAPEPRSVTEASFRRPAGRSL